MKWALLILAAVMVARAEDQIDPEKLRAAQEKLNAKPLATQPSELDRLRAENAELKKQIQLLKEMLASRPAPSLEKNGDPVLKVGMTRAEVDKEIGSKGLVESESDGIVVLTYGPIERLGTNVTRIYATFTRGKLSQFDYTRRDGSAYQPARPSSPLNVVPPPQAEQKPRSGAKSY